jgi:hypothetical protein
MFGAGADLMAGSLSARLDAFRGKRFLEACMATRLLIHWRDRAAGFATLLRPCDLSVLRVALGYGVMSVSLSP